MAKKTDDNGMLYLAGALAILYFLTRNNSIPIRIGTPPVLAAADAPTMLVSTTNAQGDRVLAPVLSADIQASPQTKFDSRFLGPPVLIDDLGGNNGDRFLGPPVLVDFENNNLLPTDSRYLGPPIRVDDPKFWYRDDSVYH